VKLRLGFRTSPALSWVVVATALAAAPGATAADPTPRPVLVFLLAGQSNMAGHGQGAELSDAYRKPPANVQLYEAGKLRPLALRQTKQNPSGGSFGPELSFGHELSRAMPDRNIILVKHAVGGTTLDGDWNPKHRGRLYDQLLRDYRAATQGRTVEPAGVLWSQGGADAKAEASAQAYAANLKELIETFRNDLGVRDLPFYIGGARPEDPISNTLKTRFPHASVVRAAFVDAQRNVPHVQIVSTVDLTMRSDGIHYDTAGQLEFGKRLARAWLEGRGTAGKSR
jgi:hypothetical protein